MASAAQPSLYFPGINWNLSFYTEGDSSASLNYVNSTFLRVYGLRILSCINYDV